MSTNVELVEQTPPKPQGSSTAPSLVARISTKPVSSSSNAAQDTVASSNPAGTPKRKSKRRSKSKKGSSKSTPITSTPRGSTGADDEDGKLVQSFLIPSDPPTPARSKEKAAKTIASEKPGSKSKSAEKKAPATLTSIDVSEPVAGPSKTSSSSPRELKEKPDGSNNFGGDDFIAFTLDSDDEVLGKEAVRVWDNEEQRSPKRSRGDEKRRDDRDEENNRDEDSRRERRARDAEDDERNRDRARDKDRDRDRNGRRRDGERRRDRDSDDYYRDRERERDGYSERRGDRDKDRGKRREREDSDGERDNDHSKRKERDSRGRDDDDYNLKRKRSDRADDRYTSRQGIEVINKRVPWLRLMDWDVCRNVADLLHCEVEAFTKWISPSPVEDEIRGLIVQMIRDAVVSAFPDAQVLPFGSYETKLYLPLGDIDLVIISKSMAYRNNTGVLYSLAGTIKRAGISDRVTIIAKAKVPIIKFVTTHGHFNVDISINQENGLHSGRIINGFIKSMGMVRSDKEDSDSRRKDKGKYPSNLPQVDSLSAIHDSLALRSLVFITKAFLSQRNMNEVFSGGLGSYSIVCLAISFLQMHPKIRRGEINAEENLGVLLMEFFELYGCYFNYKEVGISVRDGGTYFSKNKRGWWEDARDMGRNSGGMLAIEDPVDPSNNISKGSYAFPKVRAALAGAYNILSTTAYLKAGMINSRRGGRSVQLREYGYEKEDLSILSSVLGATPMTINHRRLVQELYDRRTLHNLLGTQPRSIIADSSSSRSHAAADRGTESIRAAWKGAGDDTEYDSDPNDDRYSRKRRSDHSHRSRGKGDRDLSEDDDEGMTRYAIGREPFKKRRKTERHAPTVFTTDDDEDDDERGDERAGARRGEPDNKQPAKNRRRVGGRDQGGAEEGEYVEFAGEEETEAAKRRRSYWLSKGIGYGETDDDDDYI